MSYVLKLIFISFILLWSSASPYIIDLVASSTYVRLKGNVPPPSLNVHEVFTFKVNVYDSEIIPTSLWCRNENQKYIFDSYFIKNGLFYISKNNVTAATIMNCKWSCRLFFNILPDEHNSVDFRLKVIVKAAQKPDIALNQPIVSLAPSEPVDTNSDGLYITAKENDDAHSATRNPRASKLPINAGTDYIYCHIYKEKDKVFHDTTSMLHLDKPFIFIVDLEPEVRRNEIPRWIICNNTNRLSEVFISGVLNNALEMGQNIYKIDIQSAVYTMQAKWFCKLFTESTLPITYKFDVDIRAPATPAPAPVNVNNDEDRYKNTQGPEPENEGSDTLTVLPLDEIDNPRDDRATAEDIITVRFYKKAFKSTYITDVPPTLKLGQKLKIKVENHENQLTYTKIKCNYYSNINTVFIDSKLTPIKTVFLSKAVDFTKEMATKWQCEVSGPHKKKKVINFAVDIKMPAGDYISLFVNEERMNFTDIEPDEKDFNAKAEYNYREDELAKIKCLRKDGNYMSKELYLYNGTKIFETALQSYQPDETMYIKLTKHHHASYVACAVKIIYPHQLMLTVRLIFMQSSSLRKSDEPIMKVNGLTLAPNSRQEYMYEYYNGESLTIFGDTPNADERWNCITKSDTMLQPVENQHERINLTVTLDYTKLMTSSIECKEGDDIINLKLDPFNSFDPLIHGLSLSQTLLAYQENDKNYIMKYNNKENTHLNLTCSSQKTGCAWNYNSSEVIANSTHFAYNLTLNKYTSHLAMKLEKNTDESITIKCICPHEFPNDHIFSVVLMNQLRKEVTTDAGEMTEPPEHATKQKQETRNEDDDEGGLRISQKILIGIIIGTILIVILVIWIIVGLHKRKRKLEEVHASDINYENLPEHNEGPMPLPSQWNDYSTPPTEETYTYCEPYVEKNIEDMYAQPQPKSQRQSERPELLYAEVGGQEPTYAAVEQESKRLYVNTNAKETYAQIQPKKLRENAECAPKVLPKPVNNQNYAQVVPKSVRNQAEYENVFRNQRYINADAKGEYAEPAYCEVSKTK